MLFDGSVLMNGLKQDSGRSGVFYEAYQLLNEFLKKEDIDLTVIIPDASIQEANKLKQLKIIQDESTPVIAIEMPDLYYTIFEFSTKNKDNLLKKIIRFIIYRFKRLSYLYFWGKLNKMLKNNLCDVYFSPIGKIPDVVQNDDNVKKYMIIHDLIPLIKKEFYESFGIIRMNLMEKTLTSLPNDNVYFAVSNSTKKDLLKYNSQIDENNVVLAYPAANNFNNKEEKTITNIREKYHIPEDKKYIIYLGSVEPRKNVIFAIKNYLKFVEKNNINELVFVVGGGIWKEYKKAYDEFISSVPSESVINLGYVDDEDIYELYRNAFIFVCPTFYEGFGVPVLEAMSAGCPVITSNLSSIPEVIGDAGITINPESDEEMINAYEKMYFDEEFRKSCIAKGLERANLFSWKKCANVMYEKMCKDLGHETAV